MLGLDNPHASYLSGGTSSQIGGYDPKQVGGGFYNSILGFQPGQFAAQPPAQQSGYTRNTAHPTYAEIARWHNPEDNWGFGVGYPGTTSLWGLYGPGSGWSWS